MDKEKYTFQDCVNNIRNKPLPNAQNKPLPENNAIAYGQTQPSPINMPVYRSLSSTDTARLDRLLIEQQMDLSKKEHMYQMELAHNSKKNEARESITFIRQMAPYIFCDEIGIIRMAKQIYEQALLTTPLCNMSKISTNQYINASNRNNVPNRYSINYETNGQQHVIFFSQQDIGTGKIIKKLLTNGVNFFLQKKLLTETSSTIEHFFCNNAIISLTYDSYGWNLYDDKWEFVYPQNTVWEDLKNGKYEY